MEEGGGDVGDGDIVAMEVYELGANVEEGVEVGGSGRLTSDCEAQKSLSDAAEELQGVKRKIKVASRRRRSRDVKDWERRVRRRRSGMFPWSSREVRWKGRRVAAGKRGSKMSESMDVKLNTARQSRLARSRGRTPASVAREAYLERL